MSRIHRFGRVEVRLNERALRVDGKAAPLGARAWDVLQALIERRDQIVTKNELLEIVWPGLVVEENNLQVQVSALRKLLGAHAIATIPGRGYQFSLSEDAPADNVAALPRSEITPAEPIPAPSTGSPLSIAVLPFLNLSNDPENEYFCDGLAEELRSALSKVKALHVAARSSSFFFKGKAVDVREVGRVLNVTEVLEGSVMKAGNRLRISLRLVNAATGFQIWSERYDREMCDVLDVQDEITVAVMDALKLTLAGDQMPALFKRHTENIVAYELFLKGRFHYSKRTKDDIQLGIAYFQQAIKLDPNFAQAYVGISESYIVMPVYPYLSPQEAMPRAKAAALKALEIDPLLAEAHTVLAHCLATYDWNWRQAERTFKRALALESDNAITHFRYAQNFLLPNARVDEAIREVRQAMQLEPLSLVISAHLGGIYVCARQYQKGLEEALKTNQLEPRFMVGRAYLAYAYCNNAMFEEALKVCEASSQNDHARQLFMAVAGYSYAKLGRRIEAMKVLQQYKDIAKSQYVAAYLVATVHAALGEADLAFATLEQAFTARDWHLLRLKVDPFMDGLREDPRFADLLQRMGLPP